MPPKKKGPPKPIVVGTVSTRSTRRQSIVNIEIPRLSRSKRSAPKEIKQPKKGTSSHVKRTRNEIEFVVEEDSFEESNECSNSEEPNKVVKDILDDWSEKDNETETSDSEDISEKVLLDSSMDDISQCESVEEITEEVITVDESEILMQGDIVELEHPNITVECVTEDVVSLDSSEFNEFKEDLSVSEESCPIKEQEVKSINVTKGNVSYQVIISEESNSNTDSLDKISFSPSAIENIIFGSISRTDDKVVTADRVNSIPEYGNAEVVGFEPEQNLESGLVESDFVGEVVIHESNVDEVIEEAAEEVIGDSISEHVQLETEVPLKFDVKRHDTIIEEQSNDQQLIEKSIQNISLNEKNINDEVSTIKPSLVSDSSDIVQEKVTVPISEEVILDDIRDITSETEKLKIGKKLHKTISGENTQIQNQADQSQHKVLDQTKMPSQVELPVKIEQTENENLNKILEMQDQNKIKETREFTKIEINKCETEITQTTAIDEMKDILAELKNYEEERRMDVYEESLLAGKIVGQPVSLKLYSTDADGGQVPQEKEKKTETAGTKDSQEEKETSEMEFDSLDIKDLISENDLIQEKPDKISPKKKQSNKKSEIIKKTVTSKKSDTEKKPLKSKKYTSEKQPKTAFKNKLQDTKSKVKVSKEKKIQGDGKLKESKQAKELKTPKKSSKKKSEKKDCDPPKKRDDNNDDDEGNEIRRSSRIKSISVLKKKTKGHGLVRSKSESALNEGEFSENSNSGYTDSEKSTPTASPMLREKHSTSKSRWTRSSENLAKDVASDVKVSPMDINLSNVKPKLKQDKEVESRLKQFVHLKENLFLTDRLTCKEAKKMVCDCFLTEDDIESGDFGCGDDCLNRLLMIECGNLCPINDRCTNKRFQKIQFAPVEVFNTEKKGLGLRAAANIPYGEFILEYVGEVLDPDEFEKRAEHYSVDKNIHYYFMSLRADAIIDATMKGNISRFINHSCDPNAETQKWTVNGELRIGFFSTRTILAGEEITFDYRFQRYGKEAQKCYCEAAICRGWLGERPESSDEEEEEEDLEEEEPADINKELKKVEQVDIVKPTEEPENSVSIVPETVGEEKIEEPKLVVPAFIEKRSPKKKPRKELFEDLDQLDEEIEMLVETGLKNQAHTLKLSRLMVRAKEMNQRAKLLRILRRGELPCRRLFLDYHGLRLMHGYMIDAQNSDKKYEQSRLEMLQTLAMLPIPNKSMLQDSKVLSTVENWSSGKGVTSPDSDSNSPKDHENPLKSNEEKDKLSDVKDESVKEDKTNYEEEIVALALKLLEEWSNLKEVFKIPKKERIEQMKEHEREANKKYMLNAEQDVDNKFGNRSRYMGSKYKSDRDYYKKSTKYDDRDRVMSMYKITKQERRKLFALQVELKEEERRRKQREMWREHEKNCLLIGADPRFTAPFDPSRGFQYVWNPQIGQWQNIPIPAGNNMYRGQNIPPSLPTVLPNMPVPSPHPNINVPSPHLNLNVPPAHPSMNVLSPHPNMSVPSPHPSMNIPSARSNITVPSAHPMNVTPVHSNMNAPVHSSMSAPVHSSMSAPVHPNMNVSTARPNINVPHALPNLSVPPPHIPKAVSSYPYNLPLNQMPGIPQPQLPYQQPVTSMSTNIAISQPPLPYQTQPPLPIQPQTTIPTSMGYQDQSMKIEEDVSKVKFMGPIPPPVKLPPKWKCAKDKYGRPYYYHIKIRKSQWEPPPLVEEEDESSDVSSSTESSSVSSDTDTDNSDSDDEIDDTRLLLEVRKQMEKSAKLTLNKSVIPNHVKSDANNSVTPSPDDKASEDNDDEAKMSSDDLEEDEDTKPSSIDIRLKEQFDLLNEDKPPASKKRRLGLVQEIIISPRTEEDRLQFREDLKRYKYNKEKLKREKELILQQTKKQLRETDPKKLKEKKPRSTVKARIKEMSDFNSEAAKKIKETFRSSMATTVVNVLNAYRKPDCKEARITNTEDFKHLARKLTHFVMLKEMKHIAKIEDLTCTDNVKTKAREYIKKYMSKFGETYQKRADEPDFKD